jgi:hypothetical protein
MRDEFISVWSETWREIWPSPVGREAVSGDGFAKVGHAWRLLRQVQFAGPSVHLLRSAPTGESLTSKACCSERQQSASNAPAHADPIPSPGPC